MTENKHRNNTGTKGKRGISGEGTREPGFRVQQVPETIHASKVFGSTIWQVVEAGYGFQGGQGPNLLFYDAPSSLPPSLFCARPLFSRLFPPTSANPPCAAHPLPAPHIFTISFRCQTFQLTNTGVRGNNESADPNFCTFTICTFLPWKRGGNGSESCFFFFRGPVPGSPDRSTRFQAINRPREIYTFMENLNVNKSIERECDMQSSGGVVTKGILLLLFII